jgi:hypothetical protein
MPETPEFDARAGTGEIAAELRLRVIDVGGGDASFGKSHDRKVTRQRRMARLYVGGDSAIVQDSGAEDAG